MSADAPQPQWYRDATIYELHVRAFQDSDGDGIGDFDGITQRLDHLQDLGITALWILPFYPSPRRDDGYDIAEYKAVNPEYGDLRSFKRFLREAHRRGLRVITELVVNHTSDQHPWFQRARRAAPGSRWRDFYVWSDDPERYRDARIIFQDFETSNWTWDATAGAYYWHRFYHHQPDLNYENPEVHAAVMDAMDFWFDLGVDGMRLDAVPYLYEEDGTDCENLAPTHEFLRALRAHVDERYDDRMLLAEANQWPEDAVEYFGDADECHMAFHFPLMPRLFMSLQMEDRFPIVEILQQTPEPPDGAQWALFLRNHDELTLEMVTDQERDYMYRAYAADPQMRVNVGIRRRLAPLLGNDRRKIELLNGLLLAMPGTPVVYYGDEIGMGDNVYLGDRDAVRTPMQWTGDRNAGFSSANPQQLFLPAIIDPEYHYEKVNVEAQQQNPSSLLRWMRQILTLRSRHPVFGRGELRFVHPDNPKILAFLRVHDDEEVLVVANLARTAQHAQLDLQELAGRTPVEMFGRTEFPPIGELPYLVTLAPHTFLWFSLERRHHEGPLQVHEPDGPDIPEITTSSAWSDVFEGRSASALARPLAGFLAERRWFGGKGRAVDQISLLDVVPLTRGRPGAVLALVRVEFTEGEPSTYSLPLALAGGERAETLLAEQAHGIVATVRNRTSGEVRVVYEALWEPEVCRALAEMGARRRTAKGGRGELHATAGTELRRLVKADELPEPRLLRTDQSNTSIVYGDAAILKLFRRLEPGTNPELEVGRHLEDVGFEHVAPLWGSIEYRQPRRDPTTVAVLQAHVEHEADAWHLALDALGRFYPGVADLPSPDPAPTTAADLVAMGQRDVPDDVADHLGSFPEWAHLIGRRTAQLHRALADDRGDGAFAPEATRALDRRALYQSMRSLTSRTVGTLRRRVRSFADQPEVAAAAQELVDREVEVLGRFELLRSAEVDGARIRLHGDLHLGQLLFTGRDVVFLDFEGEPLRSIGERRLKGPGLRDVAGMLRSFHYAASHGLRTEVERGTLPDHPQQRSEAERWGAAWYRWTASRFLRGYLDEVADADLLPTTDERLHVLLDALVLEKAVYELGYELENRPTWVDIPLHGLLLQLGDS